MKRYITTIFSITGKPLARIFETNNGYGFEHIPSNAWDDGFATFDDARSAYMEFHNEWFENHCEQA